MAPSQRRNGPSTPSSSKSSTVNGPASSTSAQRDGDMDTVLYSSAPSPYYLLIYPVILLIGSTFSVISPVASPASQQQQRATAMSPGMSSDLSTPTNPTTPINYFASKHNILNVYFVKILWFWTTLSFALILSTTYLPKLFQSQPSSQSSSKNPRLRLLQSLLRYTLVTLSWFLTTQWCFGPALIDRSFTLTGGKCDLQPSLSQHPTAEEKTTRLATTFSSTACKKNGGMWKGGDDISGHVFLMVISTSFLFLELYLSQTYLSAQSRLQHPHISPEVAERIARDTSPEEKKEMGGWESTGLEVRIRKYVRRAVWTVVLLGGWMLLMTAVWFHSLGEKLSGLGLAAGVIWGVYWAGRLSQPWADIVGGV